MLASHLYVLFFILSAIFGVMSWRKISESPKSPAVKTWGRMAVIFFAIACMLLIKGFV